jgi:hypothetical protein
MRRITMMSALTFLVLGALPATSVQGRESPYAYPDSGCVRPNDATGHGHGNHARGALLAPSSLHIDCNDGFNRFQFYDDLTTLHDINLLVDKMWPDSGFADYMTSDDLNALLHGLDVGTSNQLGVSWTDLALAYNYFHATDSTSFYGTFGTSHNMELSFSHGYGVPSHVPLAFPDSERTHVDFYLTHPLNKAINTIGSQHDPEEDGDPAVCDEAVLAANDTTYFPGSGNSFTASGGVLAYRDPASMWTVTMLPYAGWSAPGEPTNNRAIHEMQHAFNAAAGIPASGWDSETRSVASEYLVGKREPAATPPGYNTTIDVSFRVPILQQYLAYGHQYLWASYLMQQYGGDSTRIEDDLFYKWVHSPSPSATNGLAVVLDGPEYSGLGLGSSGYERLRTIFHNYSIAKYVNNPKSTFYAGKLGFRNGLIPSLEPGIFRNWWHYCNRFSSVELPRTYQVGTNRVNSDSTMVNYQWCVTDSFTAFDCTEDASTKPPRTTCDPTSVQLYSSDYFVYKADPALGSGVPYRLHLTYWWDPKKTNGSIPVSGGTYNWDPRLAAVTYRCVSDTLFGLPDSVLSVVEGSVDRFRGRGELWITGFGSSVKAAVIVLDVGEAKGNSTNSSDTLGYSYKFRVEVDTSHVAGAPLSLTAYRQTPAGNDILDWSDPAGYGSQGYYIQRAVGFRRTMAVVDSTAVGVLTKSIPPLRPESVITYRILPKGTTLLSNVATCGGTTIRGDTLGGVVYISGDLTVQWTDTLNVAPGAVVKFRPNWDSRGAGQQTGRTEVNVYGFLRALGTATDSIRWTSASPTPAPGDWRGLRIEGSSTDKSCLRYNNISYAYHGFQTYGVPACSLKSSTVRHSLFYGVYAQGSPNPPPVNGNTYIVNSVLEQNHGAETAAFNNGAHLYIVNCHLHYSPALGSGATDDGAVFLYGGDGNVNTSRITGVGIGVYCAGPNANANLRGTMGYVQGRNDLYSFLYYGVRAYDTANPNLGSGQECDLTAGQNSIYSRVDSAKYVWNGGPNAISAKHNYWGQSLKKDTTLVRARFVGWVDPALQNNNYYIEPLAVQCGNLIGPDFTYPGYSPTAGLSSPAELYDLAIADAGTGNIESAATTLHTIVDQYPETDAAVNALAKVVVLEQPMRTASQEAEYLSELIATTPTPRLRFMAKRMLPSVLEGAGLYGQADNAFRNLLAEPNVATGGVLLEWAMLKAEHRNDLEGARQLVDELQRTCKDPFLRKHARAVLSEYIGSDVWVEIPVTMADGASDTAGSEPDELSLDQNYPNPMNPVTTISFRIPHSGHVSLRIFDVRGRLVRTVVDGELPAGGHESRWDGRTRSGEMAGSGVYYFRLQAGDRTISRKLIVLK